MWSLKFRDFNPKSKRIWVAFSSSLAQSRNDMEFDMNRVIAAFKKVRLRQILMTFLAGVLLFVSTACNSAGAKTSVGGNRQDVPSGLQSETGVQAKNPRPEVPDAATTNRFQGGSMNEFSDVDPRTKNSEGATTKTSAKELIENAKRNIDQPGNAGDKVKRSVGDVPKNLDKVGDNLKQGAEDVKNKAQGTADDLGKAAKRGAENVKDSAVNAADDATRGVNRATEDAKDTARGAFNRSVNRTADAAKDAVN